MTSASREGRCSPLDLPEILSDIFVRIDSPCTLSACARVSRRWCKEAVPLLWQGSPPDRNDRWATPSAATLCRLASHDWARFAHLTQYIRFFRLEHGSKFSDKEELKHLWDEKLWAATAFRTVSVDIGSQNMHEADMTNLIHPSLRCLQLFGGLYSDAFLDSLTARSPDLKWLLMSNLSESMTSRGLVDFLARHGELRGLEVMVGFEAITTEPVLIQMSNLRKLDLLTIANRATITLDVLDRSQHRFSSLRSLNLMSVDIGAMEALCLSTTNLQRICLHHDRDVDDNFYSRLCASLSTCHRLEEAVLTLPRHLRDSEVIVFARKCPRIRKLSIDCCDYSGEIVTWTALRSILQHWPLLEDLEVMALCIGGAMALAVVADSCPLMRCLHLTIIVNVFELGLLRGHRTLERLETLSCKAFVFNGNIATTRTSDVETLFLSRMPRLRRLIAERSFTSDLMRDVAKRLIKRNEGRRESPMKSVIRDQLQRQAAYEQE